MKSSRLMWAGICYGLAFPLLATVVEATRLDLLTWLGIWQVQTQTPLLWIIDSAPIVLGMAGRVLSHQALPIEKAERQLFPLLVTSLIVPLALSTFALYADTKATQTVGDTNRSGALRYQSLYIYALTQKREGKTKWFPVLRKMEDSMASLRSRYPEQVAPTETAWQDFKAQLERAGRVDWTSAERMREAADRQTKSLEEFPRRDSILLMGSVVLGITSLLWSFIKLHELLNQLRFSRAAQQESEQRFAKLVEASFEGISLSQSGQIVTANEQLCSMFGYSQNEILGMKAELFVPTEARQLVREKVEQNIEAPYETLGLRRNGTTFPIEVEGKQVQFQGAPARVTAVRDLSERKRVETQLREANQRLEQIARTDELTQLFNRRAFNEQLEMELERAQRYQMPLSLLLLDIDKFKSINDEWGHDYGDKVLREVSQIIQSVVRPSDFVARYGGEELIIILPNTNQEGSLSSAERCRRAIETASWIHQMVTASFGATTTGQDSITAEGLIKAADNALYNSKQTGRNRTSHSVHL